MKTGIIQVGIAPLYAEPKEQQVLIDEGLYGMEAEILEQEGSFCRVRMEYRYEGYIHKEHIREGGWPAGERLRVLKNQIDVMNKPEVDSICLATMPRGSVLQKGRQPAPEGWISVRLANGAEGYTKKSFLHAYQPLSFEKPAAEEELLRQRLVDAAKAYEGTAYRWGGKSPQGIDCSGLCSMAYLLNGIVIYRDAAIKDGFPIHRIAKEAMKKGDLVLFKGHVAMYIGGPRKLYIHSTARAGSDGVDYNSFEPGDSLYRQDLAEGILEVGSLFGEEQKA
ncbi:MAG: C40 family peptidase [Lachnospiraceae bacterium]|nr:C40 family peptidase [Lachnospiraceae bacterium]